jgi:hypothetical protein
MPILSVPAKAAKEGVAISTNKRTEIQVRMATVEMLIGGPYGDKTYGHAALRVTTAELDRVFDYGRYGNAWGFGKSEGEGILRIWTNFNAYIAEENSLGRVTTGFVYETTEESAKKILEFFDKKIAGKPVLSDRPIKKVVKIDTYYALGPNCTTLSVAGIKTVFPDIDRDWSVFQKGRGLGVMEKAAVSAKGWPKYIFMPADLQAMLESPSAKKAKKINKYGVKR